MISKVLVLFPWKNQYTVEQLLTALLVGNSSTAALALAEKVGGSEKSFVEKMKAEAF